LVEYWDGSDWKIAASAKSMGTNKQLIFKTVTSSKIRLNILDLLEGVTSGPTIWEMQAYKLDDNLISMQ
jgi:hypothetical protein